jgi:hypothetical protein
MTRQNSKEEGGDISNAPSSIDRLKKKANVSTMMAMTSLIVLTILLALSFLSPGIDSIPFSCSNTRRLTVAEDPEFVDFVYSELKLTDTVERWDNVQARCREATYSLGVYVDHHVYILAIPDLDTSGQEDCPSIAFHDNFGLDNKSESDASSSTKEAAVLKYSHTFTLKEKTLQSTPSL